MKSIKFNAFINGIRTILNLFFPLITFPYISRVLTIEEIGKYNFSDSIVSYFLLLSALGINQYAIREGTKLRDHPNEMNEFASKVFSINIVSTGISYLALSILLLCSHKLSHYSLCITILSTQIVFTTLGMEWVYSIYEEYTYITIRSLAFKLISIICLFAFVRRPGDYIKYAVITVIASVGANLLGFIHVRKYCRIRFTLNFHWKEILKPVLVIFASNIAIQIYVNSDITMLGYLGNDHSVGIYSVSTKIYTIIKNVLTAILTVTIPRFSLYARDKEKYDKLLGKVVNTLIVIMIPVIVGLFMLSRNVIAIIAGDNYLNSQPSLRILSIAIFFSVFNGLFSQCVLMAFKCENVFLRCTVVSAVVNVCLNFIFIPLWAEVGAALTTLISELVLCIMLYKRAKNKVEQAFHSETTRKNLSSVLIATVGMGIVCLLIMKMLTDFYLQTFSAVVVSGLVYCAILYYLKNEIVISNIKIIKTKVQNKLH